MELQTSSEFRTLQSVSADCLENSTPLDDLIEWRPAGAGVYIHKPWTSALLNMSQSNSQQQE